MSDTLVLHTLQTLRHVYVEGVGDCFGATRFVQAVTGQDSKHSRGMLHNARRSVDRGELARAVLCRRALLPGEDVPIFVVTAVEAARLLACIPRKHMPPRLHDADTEQPQKTHKRPRSGFVYAAYSDSNGLKLGMTCQESPMKRVRSLNTAVSRPYALVDSVRCGNPAELERFVHGMLQPWRVGSHNRELFSLDPRAASVLFDAIRVAMDDAGAADDDEPVDIAWLHTR
jgi:hypothetical protein